MKKLLTVVLVIALATTTLFAQGQSEANSGKTTIRVLNYIDMSEPNSANEIERI